MDIKTVWKNKVIQFCWDVIKTLSSLLVHVEYWPLEKHKYDFYALVKELIKSCSPSDY